MLALYPPIAPYKEYKLSVDEIHTLHIEESGNPLGKPVLFLHGGPGIGCKPDHRRFFDPEKYRIILFDQRGCGRSIPYAELQNNTIAALSQDIELIRQHCNVEQWLLFGGSWGATLALFYAQHYPENVRAMILRGIFLCRKKDFDWFYQTGASLIYPEYWEEFIKLLDFNAQKNVLNNYYKLLTSENEVARLAAAKAWAKWEAVCSTLDPNAYVEEELTAAHVALSMARLESHYFIHDPDLGGTTGVLTDPQKIAHIPGVIVHGRYDMICPLDNAYTLSKVWPAAKLEIIRDAGHSSGEGGIINALITATNQFAR